MRPYQHNAHESGLAEFKAGRRSTLLHMATGLGKTACAAMFIKSFQPGRTLFLADTDELIEQAVEAIKRWTGLAVQVEKAGQYAGVGLFDRMPVVVSSIQTQISGKVGGRRYTRFKPEDFSLLICDEAHKAAAPSWVETVAYYQRNSNLKVLGMTATPDRHDKKKLGFESTAFTMDILAGMNEGWLVPLVQHFVPVSGLDFSHIKTIKGDLAETELAAVMEQEENVYGICQPTLEVMFGLEPKSLSVFEPPQWRGYLSSLNVKPRPAIIYTVSVAQAEHCCNVFLRAIDGMDWLCGKTNKQSRREMVERFKSGASNGLVNVGCLTHGFDAPRVEIIANGRPSKSKSLVEQIIGRGTRPLPGVVDGLETAVERLAAIEASPKKFIRILDFVGNSGAHKIVTCADVLGGNFTEEAIALAKRNILKDGKPKRILLTMKNADLELEQKRLEAAERQRQLEEARKQHLLPRVKFQMQEVNPFGGPIVPLSNSGGLSSRDGRMFSPKQAAVLRRNGYDPNKLSYGAGKAIIGKLMSGPCSPKQASWLEKRGYPTSMSREAAGAIIRSWEKNDWKRPENTVDAGQAARLAAAGKESNEPF